LVWEVKMALTHRKFSQGAIPYAALLGVEATDRIELAERVREGFSLHAFRSLSKVMQLSSSQLADLVQISESTLVRRRKAGRLKVEESERLLRFSRLYTQAYELFEGDQAATQSWLRAENQALQGKTPLEAGQTEVGAGRSKT
jgi:putative toxin-antitoxin system antitoxin component (TIGR02293 family)